MQKNDIKAFLTQHGLVAHAFTVADLPEPIQQSLLSIEGVKKSSHAVLLAHAGNAFWSAMQRDNNMHEPPLLENNNPVDHYSSIIAQKLIDQHFNGKGNILYPGNSPVPLMQLGALAGWSSPSPLGLGIHPDYGLWFAYRAFIVSDEAVPPALTQGINAPATSPCIDCESKPCISSCPADAVSAHESFNIKHCAAYRMQENSHCQHQCLARLNCPVATIHRYTKKQMAHHMDRSLANLVKWSKLQ